MLSKTVTKDISTNDLSDIINAITQDGYEVVKIKDVSDYKIIYYQEFQ